MFLIQWFARVVSLPLLWAGRLLLGLRSPAGLTLMQAAWRIGGEGEAARMALGGLVVAGQGQFARQLAAQWMSHRPRAQIAAFAGLMAIDDKDDSLAKEWLARGRGVDKARDEGLDLLEFYIAQRQPDPQAARAVAQQFIERRDLSMMVSRLVYQELLWREMFRRRYDDAARRARFMLSIEESSPAEIVLWALAKQAGDELAAGEHLHRVRLTEAQRLFYQVLGSSAIGQGELARQCLAELEVHDAAMAQRAWSYINQPEAAQWT